MEHQKSVRSEKEATPSRAYDIILQKIKVLNGGVKAAGNSFQHFQDLDFVESL